MCIAQQWMFHDSDWLLILIINGVAALKPPLPADAATERFSNRIPRDLKRKPQSARTKPFFRQKANCFRTRRYFRANTRLESNIFSLPLPSEDVLKSIEHSNTLSQRAFGCVRLSISNTVFKVIERLFYLLSLDTNFIIKRTQRI